jgi:glutathione S-transferase
MILLAELGIAYTPFRMYVMQGATKRADFRAINPRGMWPRNRWCCVLLLFIAATEANVVVAVGGAGLTPTMVLQDGTVMTESWAMLLYFMRFAAQHTAAAKPPSTASAASASTSAAAAASPATVSAQAASGSAAAQSLLPEGDCKLYHAILARAYASDDIRKKFKPLVRAVALCLCVTCDLICRAAAVQEMLFKPLEEQPSSAAAACSSAVQDTLAEWALWERELAAQPVAADGARYLVGGRFTFADVAFYPVLAYQGIVLLQLLAVVCLQLVLSCVLCLFGLLCVALPLSVHRGLDLEGSGLPVLAAYYKHLFHRPSVLAAMPTGWGTKGRLSLFGRSRVLASNAASGSTTSASKDAPTKK